MSRKQITIFLALILVFTTALWSGVSQCGLSADDYEYLATLAPLRGPVDIFHPFWEPDYNLNFFRPFNNMTLNVDFLLFGWNGGGYHLTNLLFHLLATILVFFFVRDMFDLSEKESLWCTLAFGIIASHESNLLWPAAREDLIPTIFILLMFLMIQRGKRVWAWLAFGLALLSKESAVLALPLIPILFWKSYPERKKVLHACLSLIPYLILCIAYYFYRSHYTQPILTTQPMQSQGGHSIVAFFKNGAYALGYFILPLDLETATAILSKYQVAAICLGIVLIVGFIFTIIRFGTRPFFSSLWKPFIFTLVTSAVLFLTFERWRLYLPSVGGLSLIVLIISRWPSFAMRRVLVVLAVVLACFHFYRARVAQAEWQESTALLDKMKTDISAILAKIPNRPIVLGFIDAPGKWGSASVMQVGESALTIRAEADRISEQNRMEATTTGAQASAWKALDVYALDRRKGFLGLQITQLEPLRFLVTVPASGSIALYPTELSYAGVSRRDRKFHEGDTIRSNAFEDVITSAPNGIAKSIEVRVLDTSSTLVLFNGRLLEVVGNP